MSRAPETPWLVMGPGEKLATCRRCGEVYDKPPIPLAMNLVVALLRGIQAEHRRCKEQESP